MSYQRRLSRSVGVITTRLKIDSYPQCSQAPVTFFAAILIVATKLSKTWNQQFRGLDILSVFPIQGNCWYNRHAVSRVAAHTSDRTSTRDLPWTWRESAGIPRLVLRDPVPPLVSRGKCLACPKPRMSVVVIYQGSAGGAQCNDEIKNPTSSHSEARD